MLNVFARGLPFFVASLGACVVAHAADSYSPYEADTIEAAVTSLAAKVDASPEGKTIEAIELRRLEVLEDRDPLPQFAIDFLNVFHTTSLPFTIEREILLKKGDVYEQALVDETARNLREVRQVSLVLCVPLVGSAPDRVRLLVITKDIWSLRLNSDFRITGEGLEYLLLQPSEENLGGLHHTGFLKFALDPGRFAFGTGYKIPRIADSRIGATIGAELYVNRESGELEGSSGSFSYGQPLYSTRTEWAWQAGFAWSSEISRRFVGVEVARYDAAVTPEDDAIPDQFQSDFLAGGFRVTRSFGTDVKLNVTLGVEASRASYVALETEGVDPRAQAEFESKRLPVSDKRNYPFLELETNVTDFMRTLDLNTLGLQEDFRLGHDAYVKFYPVLEALASSRTYGGATGGASYTFPMGDGLTRVYVDGLIEGDLERVFDARVSGGARVASPRLGFGRLILDGLAIFRPENYLNRRSSLGGGSRLRGYPSVAYVGENALAANLEFRSRPFELWTVQVGTVAFLDAGSAFDTGVSPEFLQSIGTGLRVVFPQLDRSVLRLDWGFPLKLAPELGVVSSFPGDIVVTFKQAFGMPAVDPPSVLGN